MGKNILFISGSEIVEAGKYVVLNIFFGCICWVCNMQNMFVDGKGLDIVGENLFWRIFE